MPVVRRTPTGLRYERRHDRTREVACRPAPHGPPVLHWHGSGTRRQCLCRLCPNLFPQGCVRHAGVVALRAFSRNAVYVVDPAFVTQTTLVSAKRTALHKQLGILGGLLALAMVLVGTAVAVALAKRGQAPGLPPPLVFLAGPFSGMVLFATLVGAGFYTRRRRDTHKRLMVLATIVIVGAATDRLLLPTGVLAFSGLPLNAGTSLGLLAIFVGACFIYDLRTRAECIRPFCGAGCTSSAPCISVGSSEPPRRGWHSLAGSRAETSVLFCPRCRQTTICSRLRPA
jgi:hypothetical protein